MPDFPKRVSFTKAWHTKLYLYISPNRPELSATGKNVVVTGSGTGIGLATAIAFAEAGADSVSIIERRLDKLQAGAASINAASKALNIRVFFQTVDLLDAEQVKSAFEEIADEVGKIDILVSNIGVLPPLGRLAGL